MKYLPAMFLGLICITPGHAADNDAMQAELDRNCEDARQVALEPLKQEIFRECLEKGKKESVCRSQVAKYNGARAGRAPLFYDLPECEKAHDYRKRKGG
jgi:hypothetical protein